MEKICLTPQIVEHRTATEKGCVKCGALFACGASAGSCWCMSVPLQRATLEILRQKYDDCLCSSCLASDPLSLKT